RVTDTTLNLTTPSAPLVFSVVDTAPTVNLGGNPGTATVGQSYTLNSFVITDSGVGVDTYTGYTIHWGDGQSTSGVGSPVGQSPTHTYHDGSGVVAITIDLIEANVTTIKAGSRVVTITDDTPTVTYCGQASVKEGSPYTLTFTSVTDFDNEPD